MPITGVTIHTKRVPSLRCFSFSRCSRHIVRLQSVSTACCGAITRRWLLVGHMLVFAQVRGPVPSEEEQRLSAPRGGAWVDPYKRTFIHTISAIVLYRVSSQVLSPKTPFKHACRLILSRIYGPCRLLICHCEGYQLPGFIQLRPVQQP